MLKSTAGETTITFGYEPAFLGVVKSFKFLTGSYSCSLVFISTKYQLCNSQKSQKEILPTSKRKPILYDGDINLLISIFYVTACTNISSCMYNVIFIGIIIRAVACSG